MAKASTRTTLAAIDAALRQTKQLTTALQALREQHAASAVDEGAWWKTPAGRLNDAGLRAIHQMFRDGLHDSEIARQLKIASATVSNHRKKWLSR